MRRYTPPRLFSLSGLPAPLILVTLLGLTLAGCGNEPPLPVGLHKVAPGNASTSFGMYGTSPESPDGSRIAYVRFLAEPSTPKDGQPGELWICNTDLTNHRKLRNIPLIRPHNGAETLWIDNKTIAFTTPWNSGPRELFIVDAETGDDRIPPIKGISDFGHNAHNGKVLFAIDSRSKENTGPPGIYELHADTGEIHSVLLLSELIADNPTIPDAALKASDTYPPEEWKFFHLMYSPDGRKLSFRLDVGKKEPSRLDAVLDTDGSNLHIWSVKLLHSLWFDEGSLVGHSKEARSLIPVRYSHTGDFIEKIAPISGNHLAISPDGKSFASENDYQSDPVILKYYQSGDLSPRKILAEFSPGNVVWEKNFHANPAFSPDGRRIYFHMPSTESTNGTYVFQLEP